MTFNGSAGPSKPIYPYCQKEHSGSEVRRRFASGLQIDDLVLFFKSIILPVLEYASTVCHTGLTQDQPSARKAVQKTAMRIIYGAMSYKDACYFAKRLSLEERRRQTAKNTLSKCKTARTFYIIYSLHYNVLRLDIPIRTRTDIFKNSFILYDLNNFQWGLSKIF